MTATEQPTLGTYKGHEIVTATISIRNTGHGLEEAMEVEPVELEQFSTVYVVLECEVEKHRYDPADNHDLQLVNMLKAGRATLVDRDLVAGALDEQTGRIQQAKAEAKAEAERDKRQLRLGDGEDEGAGPADAIDVLQEAEDTAEWRARATADLDQRSKDELVTLAQAYGIDKAAAKKLTKAELVDSILDAHPGPGADR